MAMLAVRGARRALGSLSAVHRSLSGPLPASIAAPALVPLSVPSSKLHSRTLFAQGSCISNSKDWNNPSDLRGWVIMVEFPEKAWVTPVEIVRSYQEICAEGLNISMKEAKRRIYSCKTTGYLGFQAWLTEAESKQFRGIPGVVHILTDLYTDRRYKEPMPSIVKKRTVHGVEYNLKTGPTYEPKKRTLLPEGPRE